MYRILTASADAYITDKIIYGSRSIDSNVGLAATVDLFKLYGETRLSGTQNPTELSRGLIKFDYNKLSNLTGTVLSPSGSNFKAFLHMKDVYGGQLLPSDFTLQLNPLARAWGEGVGTDVISFKDMDAVNWITASRNPTLSLWVISGAYQTGSIGDNCDYYTSGNIGIGSQSLSVTQSFSVGNEDLLMDISHLVSASIWGNLPNHGFRISFIPSQETDAVTRFVKRFGSRNANNPMFHPNLIIKYDGDVISDDTTFATFNTTNRFYVFNEEKGIAKNFISGAAGTQVTGTNCLRVELIASKSNQIYVTSWSQAHSQSITFLTRSTTYFSGVFSGSQAYFGTLPQRGIYFADVELNTFTNSALNSFVSGNNYEQSFQILWKSSDNTVLYSSGAFVKVARPVTQNNSFDQRNYVVNIINLDEFYSLKDNSRLRVFVQDWEFNFSTLRLPRPSASKVFKNMYWQVIDAYSREIVIPYDDVGTKLSSDGLGMFFDFWFEDLEKNKVYEFEFKFVENGRTDTVVNRGFRFKVTE